MASRVNAFMDLDSGDDDTHSGTLPHRSAPQGPGTSLVPGQKAAPNQLLPDILAGPDSLDAALTRALSHRTSVCGFNENTVCSHNSPYVTQCRHVAKTLPAPLDASNEWRLTRNLRVVYTWHPLVRLRRDSGARTHRLAAIVRLEAQMNQHCGTGFVRPVGSCISLQKELWMISTIELSGAPPNFGEFSTTHCFVSICTKMEILSSTIRTF